MISSSFYLNVIVRVIVITFFCYGLAYSLENRMYLVATFFLISLCTLVGLLIRFVNKVNYKIAYFFNAIKNEDYKLHIPENENIKSFQNLYQSMNSVNQMIQDISSKKHSQELFYKQILTQIDIGVLIFNEEGHILFKNPATQKLLNYRSLNHIKQLFYIDESFYNFINKSETPSQRLIKLSNEREQIQISVKTSLVQYSEIKLFLVIIQDIYRELEEKETDSWSKLIRVLTHEIMNSIAPISSISESILKYYKDDFSMKAIKDINEQQIKSTVKGLEVINAQVENLTSFVDSYRKILSIPKPSKEIVKVEVLLNNVLQLIKATAKNIKIETLILEEEMELFIDKKQIIQILLNLSKNAIHSVGGIDDGVISIVAGVEELDKKYIKIIDNGPGISEELIDEIFVPFFTTKINGTGIGLSISKQIMRLHNGTIKVNSKPFEQTSFILYF